MLSVWIHFWVYFWLWWCVAVNASPLWDGTEERWRVMHLPYHLFWPSVTEAIWSRCQNLIREWKRGRGRRGHDRNKESYSRKKKKKKTEANKGAVEAERKSKSGEVWNLTPSADSVVMGQRSSAHFWQVHGKTPFLRLLNPPTHVKKKLFCHHCRVVSYSSFHLR